MTHQLQLTLTNTPSTPLTRCEDCGCDCRGPRCSVCEQRRQLGRELPHAPAPPRKRSHSHGPKPGKGLPAAYG